jgi:hypothetical protein
LSLPLDDDPCLQTAGPSRVRRKTRPMANDRKVRATSTGIVASSRPAKKPTHRAFSVRNGNHLPRHTGYTGTFQSERGNRQISISGLLQMDFCILTETDPTVARFWQRPLVVEFYFAGRVRKHRLDFYVEHRDGRRIMWTVRTAKTLALESAAGLPWTTAYYECVSNQVRQNDCESRIASEREIRIEPRLHNAKIILRGCSPLHPKHTVFAARAALQRMPDEFSIGEFRERFADPSVDAFNALMRLIWLGDVRPDASRRFTDHTIIERIGS